MLSPKMLHGVTFSYVVSIMQDIKVLVLCGVFIILYLIFSCSDDLTPTLATSRISLEEPPKEITTNIGGHVFPLGMLVGGPAQ